MGGIDLNRFPNLPPWLARLEGLPGYQPLFPNRPDLTFSTVEIKDTMT
jgi:glutathione S-transferase